MENDLLDPNFSPRPSIGNPNTLPAPRRELSLEDVMLELAHVRQDIAALRSDLAVTFSADEFDSKRREMSDKIMEAVTRRLNAEQAVIEKYGYNKT